MVTGGQVAARSLKFGSAGMSGRCGWRVEVVEEKDTDNELVDDFVAVITSMAARIYGQRNSRRRARVKAKDGAKEGNKTSPKGKKVGRQKVREDA